MKKLVDILLFLTCILLIAAVIYKQNEVRHQKYNNADVINIKINQPLPLSGKTKKYVYNLRKKYVKKSIFYKNDYKLSDEVFGQIEDNKPWISINRCHKKNYPLRVDGPSEETRDILNPSILISLDYPASFELEGYPIFCNEPILPHKAKYVKSKNEITVVYQDIITTSGIGKYQLKGINARDFGYPYVYLDLKKSKNVVEFTNPENVTNKISEIQDFIHVGGSCKVEGGCNNGSPLQEELQFVYPNRDGVVVLYFKLWRNMPSSPENAADINEKIIIKTSSRAKKLP